MKEKKWLTVTRRVNLLRKIRHFYFESRLNLIKNFLVSIWGHESNGQALGTETAGTTAKCKWQWQDYNISHSPDTMQITICVCRRIVIYHDIHALDVDSTAKDISSHKNSFFEILKLFVSRNPGWAVKHIYESITRNLPFFLLKTRVYRDTREVAFPQQLIEFVCSRNRFDKNDNLSSWDLAKKFGEISI
jgi:hypothetical protein